MKLIFVTQQVDPEHPVLAAAVPKIRALAARVDEVVVLALHAQPGVLPANCRVRTFAAPTQALRGARFAAALGAELARGRPRALLAHMSPIYAVLAAPVLRPLGVRVLLWYTQIRTNPLLERAVRLADAVFTTDERSFPFRSPKVHAIGHGIDVARFACAEPPGSEIENTFLIVTAEAAAKTWRILARMRVRVTADGVPHPVTERVDVQEVGFYGRG